MQLRASTENTMGWRYDDLIDEFYITAKEHRYKVGTIYETRTQHGQVSNGSSSAQAPVVEEEPEHTDEQPVLYMDPEPIQGGHPGTSEPLHVHEPVASSDQMGEPEDQMDQDISFIEVIFT